MLVLQIILHKPIMPYLGHSKCDNIINSMSKQLLKSMGVVSSMTFISRILGFIRDMVGAHYFGASSSYDAFIVASKIPNFLRRLFAEGAFSQAFVPLISSYKATRSLEDLQQLLNRVCGCLSVVLLIVTLIGMLCSPVFIWMFAPGFSQGPADGRFELAAHLLKITFPYLFFISLTAFAGGILNSFGRFAVPAFTPVFLNLSMIGCSILLAPRLENPVSALAVGILIGGVVQLAFQFPFLKAMGYWPKPRIVWHDPGVKRLLLLMSPALLGVSVNQLNLMLSSIFASFLAPGSVSWLYYAERLMEFPLGGFGVALGTVVLPRLSQHHAKSETAAFSKTVDFGLRWVLLIGFPSSLGLILLAGPLLATLFQSGCFSGEDVVASRLALVAYAPGIIGFMLLKIFGSAYYAKQDIKTPVRVAMITVIFNASLSLVLMPLLAHQGLALATAISALLNAGLLGGLLLKSKLYQPQQGWWVFLGRLMVALGAMRFFIVQWNPNLVFWFSFSTFERIWHLSLLIGGAILIYSSTLLLIGLRWQHILLKQEQ